MSKIIPVTPSFVAWQRAADKLLTLETALARSKRAVLAPEPESPGPAELETSVAEVRLIADGLFQIAFAEANRHVETGRRHPRVSLGSQ
jgi:hypothetical protein